MCGIICAINTGTNTIPVNDAVLLQFEDQKERGMNGFGIIKIKDEGTYKIDRATEGYKFMWDIHADPVRKMIIHHRTPTSSDNRINQTHPIVVDNGSLKYKYYVVHNGIIQNDDEMKKEHESLGFIYSTQEGTKFNDSECVAIEVARFIEKQIDKIGARGSATFVCIQIDKKTDKVIKLFFGRNTNPLKMAKTRGKLFLSSTGQGNDIEADTLYECKLDEDMKLSKRNMKFTEWIVTTPVVTVTNYGKENAKGQYQGRGFYGGVNGGGINLFDDEEEKRYYRTLNQEEKGDIPEEEMEQTEIEMLIEEKADEIQKEIDSFFDLLYDQNSAASVNEKDIDFTLESVKIHLLDIIKEAQTVHMNEALVAENLSVTGT